jgi:hypothetical protein
MSIVSNMSIPSSQKSYLSEGKVQRLAEIKKREDLKGMLITKFKNKYGGNANSGKVIEFEVNKFMKNQRLTEENLKVLDLKIQRETELKSKQKSILEERSMNKARPSTTASKRSYKPDDDLVSTKSMVGSTRSKYSKKTDYDRQSTMSKPDKENAHDNISLCSVATPQIQPSEMGLDEEDEWAAIQKFNMVLHHEE